MQRKIIAAALFALSASPSYAQTTILNPVTPLANGIPVSTSAPMPVTGSFSASLGGFTPSATGARGTPLTVTTADSSGSLPTGTVVAVTNAGTNPMYCNVNGIAATVADQLIVASGWFAFTIPSGITTLHCIATGGSTTANTVGGSGLPTGTGGGSGGGGGGGAVFGPTAVGTAAANPPVLQGGTIDGTATGAVAVQKIVSGVAFMNNAQWAGTTLGSPSNYGTSPGAVAVPGVNAFVTNTVPVTGTFFQATQPVSLALAAPVSSTATEGTHVLKGSAGNLFSLTVTIGAVSGWAMVFDATTAPADGSVTPKYCRYIKSDGTGGATSLGWVDPLSFTTGISVAFSSTGCFTKTASSTAFFTGQVQ